ncbi:MAG: hypothetical protein ABI693_13525, partial [Bryobacteraceae bacterium]
MGHLYVSLVTSALVVLSFPGSGGAIPNTEIAVAVSSNAPAFKEALDAFMATLGNDGARVLVVQLDNAEPSKSLVGWARPRIAVAFGSRASEVISAFDPSVPLVVTMV